MDLIIIIAIVLANTCLGAYYVADPLFITL